MNRSISEGKIKVGISIGDVQGVGPEIIVKAFAEHAMLDVCTPVIYGNGRVLSFYKKALELESFNFVSIKNADEIIPNKVNVINVWNDEIKIEPGISNPAYAKLAVQAIDMATQDVLAGKIHCLVTAPIEKKNLKEAGFDFPGHTEYLGKKAGGDALMIMVHEQIRVALVTGHVALKEISSSLTVDKITKKIKQFNESLIRDFNVRRPKIAVLALNPHASDGGKFGNEEAEIIIPALNDAQQKGMLVMGPFPADGFFASGSFAHYDGILAMYHDQGLIPFKTISAMGGVNYTAGLNIVRTSPDHGAAFDIAGKGKANEASFREAIYLACDVVTTRKNQKEYSKNPLKNLSKELADRDDE